MALIRCIECDHDVSDSARLCPHCNQSPHGATCLLCGGKLPSSQAISRRGAIYHNACLERFKDEELRAGFACPECHKDMSGLFAPDILLEFFFNDLGAEAIDKAAAEEAEEAREKWTGAADRAHVPEENLNIILGINLKVIEHERINAKFRGPSLPCPFCAYVDVLGNYGVCSKCLLPIYTRLHGYWELGVNDNLHDPGCIDASKSTSGKFHPAESSDAVLVARAERASRRLEEEAARRKEEAARREVEQRRQQLTQLHETALRDLERAETRRAEAQQSLASLKSHESDIDSNAVLAGLVIGLFGGLIPGCIVGVVAGGFAGLLAWVVVAALLGNRWVKSVKKRKRTDERMSTASQALAEAEKALQDITEMIANSEKELRRIASPSQEAGAMGPEGG